MRMRKIVALLALMLAGLTVVNAASIGVDVEVTLDQKDYLPGEDVVAIVRINNRSGREIELGGNSQWLSFNVQGERGYLIPKTGEVPLTDKIVVRSAQVVTRRVNITPYFDFARPGRYHVTATVNIAQWQQQLSSKPAMYMVMTGAHLVDAPELEFGVPPKAGDKNSAPEIRKYVLEKASYASSMKLYLRLMDANGRSLRVFPIDRMVSFSKPETQIDEGSNLHVLHQTGAHDFNYCIISPDGDIVLRQTYQYTATRPTLRKNDDGKVFVAGGIRLITARDYPPATASLSTTKPDAQTSTP
jgi:hypothetical protein